MAEENSLVKALRKLRPQKNHKVVDNTTQALADKFNKNKKKKKDKRKVK